MEQNKTAAKYKVLKWVGGVLGVILILVGIASIYISSKWKPVLTEKLKQGVRDGSGGMYNLDFKDIHLNIITGTAILDSVRLLPDTAIYNQLRKAGDAPANIYRVELSHLKFARIGILTAYFKKKVEMNAIVLDRPSIDIIHFNVPKRPDTIKEERTLYQQISKTLKSIHVKAIRVIDADLDYVNGTNYKPLNSVKHLNINVKNLLIDSLSQFDTTRVFHAKDINFELTGYRSTGKDKMYTIKVDTISGSVAAKTIDVVGVQMIPLHPDLEFTRKYKYGKDRYDLKFNQISFSGVDFIGLNKNSKLHAQAITIGPA
ncbi:MAG: hypothetical protein EOO92_08015, partial [Pedobacter sp.]